MTVKRLIEILQSLPQGYRVEARDDDGDYVGLIESDIVNMDVFDMNAIFIG